MVRVESWIVCETRKEGLVAATVILVGRRLDWGILHALELRVYKWLCTRSRTW